MPYHATIVATAALLAAAAGGTPLHFRLDLAVLSPAGTQVEMHYTATCSPATGSTYALRVTVAQRTGRTVTTAATESRRACTGRPQAVWLRAAPDIWGTTFRPGRLSITACLHVHNTLPHRPAWETDSPACTGTPQTTVVAVLSRTRQSTDPAQVSSSTLPPGGSTATETAIASP
jgi:hypothetical protein